MVHGASAHMSHLSVRPPRAAPPLAISLGLACFPPPTGSHLPDSCVLPQHGISSLGVGTHLCDFTAVSSASTDVPSTELLDQYLWTEYTKDCDLPLYLF